MADDTYEVLNTIGRGSFGVIRKVRRKVDGQILCRKEINYGRMSHKEKDQLHAEFKILSSLRHPNIVGYYHREHLKTSSDLHLYMEYCGNGDLGRMIKDLQTKNQLAEEALVWSMFSQLVTALYRCHYGVDPPEVGVNVMGLASAPKPKAGGIMILHRDLKPENVFLGEDNSVKLGDFGLSKAMASHDFASTYVGTPFYMSPEICAAERYTLKSDIWSLGCIIYELCAKEPPFNAKSHFQLVQRIKEGKIAPLPNVYSPALSDVIKDCLKVNPDRRPDTATLLNLPIVRLMRKEREVVDIGRVLKTKEDDMAKRLHEAESKMQKLEHEKAQMEASLRREWEVKAQLEINRLVQVEIQKLNAKFEEEVQARVQSELAKIQTTTTDHDIPLSSVGTSGDGDFPSTTDLTELSIDSPDAGRIMKRSTRTPFARAQTMFAGTPMDVEMGEASPVSIASLSLSPRRHGAAKPSVTSGNIFATVNGRWQPSLIQSDDSDDELPPVPSPTRLKSKKNTFSTRPPLMTQRTAPANKLPNLFNQADRISTQIGGTMREKPTPRRRLSKVPSQPNLHEGTSKSRSPSRKPSRPATGSGDDLTKLALKNMTAKTQTTSSSSTGSLAPKGRTLVELAQARAGGRSLDETGSHSPEPRGHGIGSSKQTTAAAAAAAAAGFGKMQPGTLRSNMIVRDARLGLAVVTDKSTFAAPVAVAEPAVWDPEREEMPSPFLKRRIVF